MKTDQIIRDPVFQLNTLLWMAKEQPSDNYRVRPLFFELGFRIIYIEQPFPLPPETSQLTSASGLDISSAPEPELILGRAQNGKALYFEAKANSFGPESSNSRQARGHLIATGPPFQEVLKPLTSCLLCYLVPEERRAEMRNCLTTLASELADNTLEPGSFSCHGLMVSGTNLVYKWDSAFKDYLNVAIDSAIIVEDLQDDTDPSPLLLVFSDDDCPNQEIRDFYRRALLDQVRARLLCDLQALPLNQEYEMSADELLMETSDGVFQYLGRQRQKKLRVLIQENLFKRIHDYWSSKQTGIRLEEGQLRIRWQASGKRAIL